MLVLRGLCLSQLAFEVEALAVIAALVPEKRHLPAYGAFLYPGNAPGSGTRYRLLEYTDRTAGTGPVIPAVLGAIGGTVISRAVFTRIIGHIPGTDAYPVCATVDRLCYFLPFLPAAASGATTSHSPMVTSIA